MHAVRILVVHDHAAWAYVVSFAASRLLEQNDNLCLTTCSGILYSTQTKYIGILRFVGKVPKTQPVRRRITSKYLRSQT
jgi:hypothetical protein